MAMIYLFPVGLEASHYRGGAASYTINASGVVTVTVYTGWVSTSVGTPTYRIHTGSGGTGTNLGSMTAGTPVNPFATGTELGGSGYTVRKDTFTYNLSGQVAGFYYAWWSSNDWVAGIRNMPESTWSLELKIAYTPGQASAGPTMIPATIDIIGRGYPYTQNLNSQDPDGTPVTYQNLVGYTAPDYAPSSLIPGISVSASGTVGIPGSSTATMALGRWSYKVRVVDGSGATAIRDVLVVAANPTDSNVNLPPVLGSIGPKTVGVGSPLNFTVNATDPDAGQTLTVRSSTRPSGATFPQATGPNTGVSSSFAWTPTAGQEGTYVVNFEVFDNANVTLIDSEEVTITVTGSNNPPVLAAVGSKSVANGGTLTFNLSATDPDGDSITYQMFNGPAGATLSAAGAFAWTPTAGQYNTTFTGVTLRATDNGAPNLTDNETITITVGAGNNQPVTTATLTHTVNVGQNLSFVVSGSDADTTQTLTLSANAGVPSGATFTTVAGLASAGVSSTFSWTPTLAQVGAVTVKFLTQDNGTPVLNQEITVTINVTNSSAPEIAVTGNGNAITSGSAVAAVGNHTDFGNVGVTGSSLVRTYTIANSGSDALTLAGTAPDYVTLSGHTTDFTVTTQPMTPVAATSGSTTFVITFDPTSVGPRTATVTLLSNDADESPYTFTITGNGQAPLPIPSALDDVVTAGNAPGADGTSNIGQFGVLRRGGFLAENGFLAFPGFLQGVPATSNSGLWKTGGGNLFLLARTGTTVPDVPSATFATLPEVPWISESGLVSFLASMTVGTGGVTTANDTGLWSEIGGGGLRLLLREDDEVPGKPGVKIGSFASGIYATASTGVNSGHAIVSVTFKGASTKSAVLRAQVSGATTTISVVAEESTAAPGTAAVYANVSGSYTDPGRMDAQGNFIYSALTTTSSREGIWYQPVGGAVSKVFYAGETAPGTGGATFARLQRPASGDAGVIAFRATLNRDGDNAANMRNDGIWRGTASNPASFTCILRRGDGSSVVSNLPVGSLVGNPWGGWLNNNNRGAWRAWLDVNGDGNSAAPTDVNAIFTDLSGAMQLALRVGDAAPGTTGATFSGFDLPIVGGNNQYAIIGNLAGGDAVTANNQGLWRSAPNGGALSLVFRKGASVVTTEGSKVVTKIDLPGSGQTDRRWEQPVMDSAGRLVVYVTFADGSTSQVIIP